MKKEKKLQLIFFFLKNETNEGGKEKERHGISLWMGGPITTDANGFGIQSILQVICKKEKERGWGTEG